MLKIKNADIFSLMSWKQWSGLTKLMNHWNLDWDKAYDLSLLVPELEKQFKVIQENRNRISLKVYPDQDKFDDTPKGKAEKDAYLDNAEKITQFNEEFNKVLEKEVEIEWNKVVISREKDEKGMSELNKLNLTATDLIILRPLIEIK